MTDLMKLAERCEQAKCWDNALDEAIALAVLGSGGDVRLAGMDDREPSIRLFHYPDGSKGTAMRYSGSVDAAMTLVPEGRGWVLRTLERTCEARIAGASKEHLQIIPGESFSPALALCAAALRARSSDYPHS